MQEIQQAPQQTSVVRDHLTELKHKKEVYRKWKTGYTTKEEYRSITCACRDGIHKTKVWLVLK